MQRQAATDRGLKRRFGDLCFEQVPDNRQARKVRHPLATVLTALVAAMVTMARSLRAVERRTCEISTKHGKWLGIGGRIADNTLSRVRQRLSRESLVGCLHRLVKAEHRRGNLKPTRLPLGTVAIDGKNTATLHWPELCRLFKLDPKKAQVEEVRERFAEAYPEAQLCVPEQGWLDWTHERQLVRVRRVVVDSATGKKVSIGDRFYVSSLPVSALSAPTALDISRGHWRCENCTHWTVDAELGEDRRQLAWPGHPHGVIAVAVLRLIALAILAVARQLSRFDYTREKPSWGDVATHYLIVLCGAILQTEAFDNV